MVYVALATLTILVTTDAYSINFLDCSSPQAVKTFQKHSLCDGGSANLVNGVPVRLPEKSLQASLSVLQRRSVREFSGHSCAIKVSTFMFRCGAWSHLKLARPPSLGEHLQLTTDKCREVFQTRRYSDRWLFNGIPVQPDQPVVTSTVALGSLKEEDDSVVCTGETFHDTDVTHSNVVLIKHYEINLETRKFLVLENDKVEVIEDHYRLPCHHNEGGCLVGQHTYIWSVTEEHCPLTIVKHLNQPAWTMNSFIVDHHDKFLVNTTRTETTYPGCTLPVISTEYPDLYLTTSPAAVGLKPVSPRDVQVSVHSAIKLSYLSYSLESKLSATSDNLSKKVCRSEKLSMGDSLIQLEDARFGRIVGDIVYLFTCVNRTDRILEAEFCYSDIPISEGFVDPATRLYKNHSTRVPCHRRFPMVVESTNGWIEILPELKPITAPRKYQHQTTNIQSEDFKDSGLYTANELKEFQHLLTFPDYKKALLNEVSLGNCVTDDQCKTVSSSDQITAYNFNQLVPAIVNEFDILHNLDNWIHSYGDYLAALCILLIFFKLFVNLIILTITWMRAGPSAALAFLTHLCLSKSRASDKIVRRRGEAQRKNRDCEHNGSGGGENDYCLPEVNIF